MSAVIGRVTPRRLPCDGGLQDHLARPREPAPRCPACGDPRCIVALLERPLASGRLGDLDVTEF